MALIEDRQHTQDRSEEMSRWFHCAISTQFNGHYGIDRTKAYMQTALTTNERGRVDDKWTLNSYFPNQYPYSFKDKKKTRASPRRRRRRKVTSSHQKFRNFIFPCHFHLSLYFYTCPLQKNTRKASDSVSLCLWLSTTTSFRFQSEWNRILLFNCSKSSKKQN